MTLLINKWKWHVTRKNQEQENMSKDMDIFVICEKSITQIWEKNIALFTAIIVIRGDNTAKAGLGALKTSFKNSSS